MIKPSFSVQVFAPITNQSLQKVTEQATQKDEPSIYKQYVLQRKQELMSRLNLNPNSEPRDVTRNLRSY